MQIILFAASAFTAVIGLLMITSPSSVRAINNFGNFVIFSEKGFLKIRIVSSVVFIAAGAYMLLQALNYAPEAIGMLAYPIMIVGLLLLLFGLLSAVSSTFFEAISAWKGKEIANDRILFEHPRIAGTFFIFSAILLFYSARLF